MRRQRVGRRQTRRYRKSRSAWFSRRGLDWVRTTGVLGIAALGGMGKTCMRVGCHAQASGTCSRQCADCLILHNFSRVICGTAVAPGVSLIKLGKARFRLSYPRETPGRKLHEQHDFSQMPTSFDVRSNHSHEQTAERAASGARPKKYAGVVQW